MAQKNVADLEDEMDRFEQEISGHMPPPPADHFVPPDGFMPPPPPDVFPPMPRPGFLPPPMRPPHMPMPPLRRQNIPMPPRPPNMPMGMRGPMPGPMPGPMRPAPMRGPMSRPMRPVPLPTIPPALPPMPVPPMMPPMMDTTGSGVRYVSQNIRPPSTSISNHDPNSGDLSELLGSDAPSTSADDGKKKKEKKKTFVRVAGGTVWEDDSLLDWDPNDFRLFVGDIGNEVSDDALLRAFNHYPSLLRAKVIRDKRTKKTKGFGFISFKDPQDYLKAMREMNGKYIGNRPIKLRKSTWKDRNIHVARKKEREKKKLGLK